MGFGRLGRLFLLFLAVSNDVDMYLPLALLLLVGLAGRGGQRERKGKGRRAYYLGLCLSQEALLWGVGVLVGEKRGEKRERAVTGRAAELGAGLQ